MESNGIYIDNGYLFKAGKLCIPKTSMRRLLIQEAHEGRGHFVIPKTLAALKEHFYWPKMLHHVTRFCKACVTCVHAKSRSSPQGLYTPLPIPDVPWEI